jgi:hypothetical protein
MICCVIANEHWMYGLDLHEGNPALLPPTIPLIHFVFAKVRSPPDWNGASDKESASVRTPYGAVMSKIYDIGSNIPHLSLGNHPVWMLLLSLLSSSSGHYGVASVETDRGPIAAALWYNVGPQLNCNYPLSMPTGSLSVPNTVVAGMTLGDMLAGHDSMLISSLVDYALSRLGEVAAKALGNMVIGGLVRILPVSQGLYAAVLSAVVVKMFPEATEKAAEVAGDLLGKFAGDNLDANKIIKNSTMWEGRNIDANVGRDDYFENAQLSPPFPWNLATPRDATQ